jgi:hypothetical protein
MRLLGILLITALLMGASAAAVGPMRDREIFTPPPEAVAEGFMREVMSNRYDQARAYLVKSDAVSNDVLGEMEHQVEGAIGDVHDVKSELASRTDNRALVVVRMKSAQSSDARGVALEWEDGEWKVALHGASDTIPANARRRP